MTRQEQDYYNDVSKQTTYLKRIADSLDKIVNKEKDDRIKAFKNTANLLYGNDATVKPDKGRSDDNYTYPQFVSKHYKKESSHGLLGGNLQDVHMKESISALESFTPDIQSDLDERIHKESQSITGGEFSNWHSNLTAEERESYQRIYGH